MRKPLDQEFFVSLQTGQQKILLQERNIGLLLQTLTMQNLPLKLAMIADANLLSTKLPKSESSEDGHFNSLTVWKKDEKYVLSHFEPYLLIGLIVFKNQVHSRKLKEFANF